MTNVLVVGGAGQIGSIVVNKLRENTDLNVDVADVVNNENLDVLDESYSAIVENYDVIVSCLPAAVSEQFLKQNIHLDKVFVDVSYMDYNLPDWRDLVAGTKSTLYLDCGFAPGLSNLLVGQAWKKNRGIYAGHIYVGGVSKNPEMPYGYTPTWSVNDLYEEYTRPARYLSDGKIITEPSLSKLEKINVGNENNDFQMEAFLTDGLRSLLNMPNTVNFVEKTLRWPGHCRAMQHLVNDKQDFVNKILECPKTQDMTVLYMYIDGTKYLSVEYGTDEMTAMQKMTAFPAVAFTNLAINIGSQLPGSVILPEDIGASHHSKGVLQLLEEMGVKVEEF